MGPCGLTDHFAAFSVRLRSRHVTQFWPEASTLHTYKEAYWKLFLPSVGHCVCLVSQPSLTAVRQPHGGQRMSGSRAERHNKPELLTCLTCWISQLCTILPVLFCRWNDIKKKNTLYFRTVLDLWNSWEDGKEFLYILYIPSFSGFNSLYQCNTYVTIKNRTLI